jgi:hypothetical protein
MLQRDPRSAEDLELLNPPIGVAITRGLDDAMNVAPRKVLIVSPGGMGCTFVLRAIAQCGFITNARKDEDGLKHHFDPRDARYRCFNPDRVVYVWNNPLLAIMSLHRRGWLDVQHDKLTGIARATGNSLEQLWSETAAAGHDVFGIAAHYEMWRTRISWPTFVMDLRDRDGWQAALARFLSLGEDALSNLRPRDRAAHDLASVPEVVRRVYARLDELVQATREPTARADLPR